MRCVPSDDDPHTCRRCQRTDVPCVFVPRANAATLPSSIAALAAAAAAVTGEGAGSIDARFKSDVLRRLRVLEEYLGLAASSTTSATATATAAAAAAAAAAEDEEAAAAGTDTDGDGHEDTTTMMNVDEEDNGESSSDDADEDLPANYASLGALWQAVEVLKASVPVPGPASVPRRIWKKRTVGELWLAFHERMPGLHFMPRKQIFSLPQPLLLASILYCSSVRGPREAAADLAPHYFAVLCNAIAQLSIPDSAVGRPNPATGSGSGGGSGPDAADPDAYEEWAFQTVLGIVLAGLLTEASNRVVGLWISIAYRLILEYCPSEQAAILPTVTSSDGHGGDGAGGAGAGREWRKLFSGVQIIDLEHASLHLSCPVIPLESPLPALNLGYRDQLYRLSRMMHIGLTHFTGRGLPTIWSVFTTPMTTPPLVAGTVNSNSSHRGSSRSAPTTAHVPMFTPIDAAVIRDWARQLDDWLVEFSRSTPIVSSSTTAAAAAAAAADAPQSTAERQRKLVFRQYVLHRLVVLSIYHPARGCDLWSNSITPQEQHELLLSARATLKLHLHDNSIWANWDLVMITWAALIVVQGIEGGVGEADGAMTSPPPLCYFFFFFFFFFVFFSFLSNHRLLLSFSTRMYFANTCRPAKHPVSPQHAQADERPQVAPLSASHCPPRREPARCTYPRGRPLAATRCFSQHAIWAAATTGSSGATSSTTSTTGYGTSGIHRSRLRRCRLPFVAHF